MAAPRLYVAGTTTDIAPVAALPTTAAQFALWNGEPTGGKTYTISAVGMTTTTSAGAAQVLQLLANNSVGPVTLISGTACQGPKACDGLFPNSKAQVATAVTIVNSGVWHPVSSAVNSAALTATISMGTWSNVRGIYTVPPGGVFALAAFCNAAGSAKCCLFVTWEEAQF